MLTILPNAAFVQFFVEGGLGGMSIITLLFAFMLFAAWKFPAWVKEIGIAALVPTETAYYNGYISRLGKLSDTPTPINDAVCELISRIENDLSLITPGNLLRDRKSVV